MSEAEQVPASAPEAASAVILDALNATDSNGTEALNATAKFVATPEGTALAYGSLVFMALLPIFFGALRSVTCSKSKVTAGKQPLASSREQPQYYCIIRTVFSKVSLKATQTADSSVARWFFKRKSYLLRSRATGRHVFFGFHASGGLFCNFYLFIFSLILVDPRMGFPGSESCTDVNRERASVMRVSPTDVYFTLSFRDVICAVTCAVKKKRCISQWNSVTNFLEPKNINHVFPIYALIYTSKLSYFQRINAEFRLLSSAGVLDCRTTLSTQLTKYVTSTT